MTHGPADLATTLETLDSTSGTVVFRLDSLGHFVVTGRHRARFVHNMTTCDIKGLSPGQGNFGLFVEGRGRLVAQFHVEVREDSLLIETGRDAVAAVIAQLTRFRVADDVHFTEAPGYVVLSVIGSEAGRIGPADLAEYAWVDTEIHGVPAVVRRTEARLARPAIDVRVAADEVDAVLAALAADGVTIGSEAAYDVARVQACWPADGVDLDSDNVPLESERLYETIDWDKGCYIGQEVIAMMHYRGRPNKHLRRLSLPSADSAPGDVLTSGDREVGRLTSVATDPRTGQRLGLAVIKRKFAEPGTTLAAGNRGEATVL